ncbi:multiheme c-type cytochrome [Marinicella litoralis]|uniref:Putative CXXCH cytochrome family protein n=1 Tax=Marinicella litoralis TaxID=644220 RepID=A0A4R6Y041_9GAMM|nr:multiheme c-type cytochrome [Marinicella litoralis]TDR23453.1 putative CXXCH cytochrome family protein [Marinicella litoralis]
MKYLALLVAFVLLIIMGIFWLREPAPEVFHADFVGSQVCGDCHWINYDAWKISPHHNIAHEPKENTIVGNFSSGQYYLPQQNIEDSNAPPVAKMYQRQGEYFMALRDQGSNAFTEFKIDKVIGYQYRQTYLTQEVGGVLRRLPIQWSVPRQSFFAYWNEQEQSPQSVHDLWEQMKPMNSAWNLYCARCHTTNLQEISKDNAHTVADVQWTEIGVGCEVCHGPGSQHVDYMQGHPINRMASWLDQNLLNKTAPFIINAGKQEQGFALSVCARCHGADIFRKRQPLYRNYKPGFDQHGQLNDLSAYFTEAPLEPGRTVPTIEVWPDGRPKGLGTMFRSFADSSHYQATDMRCYTCHDPHNNKKPASTGLLRATEQSNEFCLSCHQNIEENLAAHTNHTAGKKGSFCYDCHMPKNMLNQVSGVTHLVRTHNMGSIPNPLLSKKLGVENSPNACHDCHQDQSQDWIIKQLRDWGMDDHLIDTDLHLQRNANSDSIH